MSATAVAASSGTSARLSDLVKRRALRQDIADHLNALTSSERLEQVIAVGGSLVGRLYDAVGGGEPLTLEDFVAEDDTRTVIFEGKNSLPAFTRFQKRFARVKGTVVGYNHQLLAPITGPGYFVVRPPTPGESHPDELFFDYTVEPPGFPPAWPAFKPNSQGPSRLVYMHMKDYCRRVAKGVLVGKAYKKGVSQNAYFTLTRP
jgi:hypothetical protein